MENKFCPMTMNAENPRHCLRDSCAWWKPVNENDGQCAVSIIATEMFVIADVMIKGVQHGQ